MKRLMTFGLGFALAGSSALGLARATESTATRPTAVKELPTYRDVVKRVLPAVVSIEAKPKAQLSAVRKPPTGQSPFDGMPGLPDELRKHFERLPKPQEPGQGKSMGSGFVVDPSGVILTNEHVVRGSDEVEVTFPDGRKFTGRNIKRDAKTDLAVVRIEAGETLPFLKLGNSSETEVGDRVLAIGAPLGMTGSVTSGIISAKGRDIRMNMYEDFLQTDAAINPGNSGGPLVNLDGDVVGINSAIKSGTGGFQGIGLAISANLAKNVMDQLRQNGSVNRGYLGVQAAPLDAEVATRLGSTEKGGVVISKVGPGTPAAKSGLQDGDILTSVNGQAVKDPRQLQQVVAGLPIGKQIDLAIVREGARKVMPMTVEVQPESFGAASDLSEPAQTHLGKFGIKMTDLTAEMAKKLGIAEKSEGALIAEVEPDSIAGNAGLQRGSLIVKVDGTACKSAKEVEAAFEKGSLEKGILVQVRTLAGTSYVMLKSPAAR